MSILQLIHVGIAVKNLDKALCLYNSLLGLKLYSTEELSSENLDIAFLGCTEISSPASGALEMKQQPIEEPLLPSKDNIAPGENRLAFSGNEFSLHSLQKGNVLLELISPRSIDSPVGRFIEKHGEGLHHVAFSVDDLESTIDQLKQNNMEIVPGYPRLGAHGRLVAFLNPQSTNGVLVELCE